MKVNELMIGDWVYSHGKFCDDKRRICKEDFYKDFNPDPIPLTKEIIEKNGFKFNGLAYIGSVIDLTKSYASSGCWECGKFYIVGHGDPGFTTFCVIKYVHELQRALKLCRITKEIIL